jgi:hypothetical protein
MMAPTSGPVCVPMPPMMTMKTAATVQLMPKPGPGKIEPWLM